LSGTASISSGSGFSSAQVTLRDIFYFTIDSTTPYVFTGTQTFTNSAGFGSVG